MIQYHDEVVIPLEKGREEEIKQTIQEAITAVNDAVKLNVPLGVSVDLGINYAKIH
jgi:DNA polymerase I-like protein with 3'-5' exonuclease and polymerase domains